MTGHLSYKSTNQLTISNRFYHPHVPTTMSYLTQPNLWCMLEVTEFTVTILT